MVLANESKRICVRPRGSNVVIKRDSPDEQTASGILLPRLDKRRPDTGEVVAANETFLDDKGRSREVPVKVGERVIFGAFDGTEIVVEDETYLVLESERLFAVLD